MASYKIFIPYNNIGCKIFLNSEGIKCPRTIYKPLDTFNY